MGKLVRSVVFVESVIKSDIGISDNEFFGLL